MARRYPIRKIKSHRAYTFEEVADELGCSIQTVRTWSKQGLSIIDDKKPYLALGGDLKNFHAERVAARKFSLGDTGFLCTSCKTVRQPLGAMADYIPLNDRRGYLEALCCACERRMCRFVQARDLNVFSAKLEIAVSAK